MAAIDDLIDAGVDSRLTGVDLLLFSNYVQGGTSTWSATCWCADFDFSGVSFFDDGSAAFNSALVSPRDVVFSDHTGPKLEVNDIVEFVNRDGTLVTRTIAGTEKIANNPIDTDIRVGHLNADMPLNSDGNPWTFYPVLPANYDDFLTSSGHPLDPIQDRPVILIDQERKMTVEDVGGSTFESLKFNRDESVIGDRAAYFEILDQSGDSSNPTFLIVDDVPVLMGMHWRADQDSNLTTNIDGINTAMSNLGSAYQLTQYNLGAVLQSVDQVTALSVMGIPGPARSFVAKTAAGKRTFNLIASQILVDGSVQSQILVDGSVRSQVLVDGSVQSQVEPS